MHRVARRPAEILPLENCRVETFSRSIHREPRSWSAPTGMTTRRNVAIARPRRYPRLAPRHCGSSLDHRTVDFRYFSAVTSFCTGRYVSPLPCGDQGCSLPPPGPLASLSLLRFASVFAGFLSMSPATADRPVGGGAMFWSVAIHYPSSGPPLQETPDFARLPLNSTKSHYYLLMQSGFGLSGSVAFQSSVRFVRRSTISG
ncbi:MAG: hypothetical protein RLY20_29 [Verrucomicrobiota bacterium]